ncbi:MAG: hypothetical protein JEY79_14180 [Pseudodesulfovibrio sp.]|nr:hypothetical protein [Pseudodesulfovibrio sp.]
MKEFWKNEDGNKPEDIISEEEVESVHGYAQFGPFHTKREIINRGVLKCAMGYHQGNTARHILHDHGLIDCMYGEGYRLTTKGRAYLVATWNIESIN